MNNKDIQKTVEPTNVEENVSTTDTPQINDDVKATNVDTQANAEVPLAVKDDPEVQKDVQATIQQMDDKILVLESYEDDGSDEAVKTQIDNLIQDVISFLNNMKDQSQNVYNNAKDSQQAKDALAYINKTADSVFNEARSAINDLKENPQLVDNYAKMKVQFDAGVNKLNEKVDGVIIELRKNDNFMQAVNTIEHKTNEIVEKTMHSINEFAQRDDVQSTLEKAKDATIDVSQKAADFSQKAADAIRKALKKSD